MKKIAIILCFALMGCTTQVGLIDPETLYPDAITHCMPDPAVPPRPVDGSPRTDTEKANYLSDVHAAGQDCRDTVASTAQRKALYLAQFNSQTKDFVERSVDAIKGALPF